jgi:hypothetical protein
MDKGEHQMKEITVITVLVVVLVSLSLFGGAWILMLVLGAIAHLMTILALAISYWASFFINLLFSIVGSYFRSTK